MHTISCPRCHRPIDSNAITCPHCRLTLKAYGHPGIPLHRAKDNNYLCDSCIYHADNTCNFPQRPQAKECTLYQNLEQRKQEIQQKINSQSFGEIGKKWIKRYQGLLLLMVLLLICFLFVLLTS